MLLDSPAIPFAFPVMLLYALHLPFASGRSKAESVVITFAVSKATFVFLATKTKDAAITFALLRVTFAFLATALKVVATPFAFASITLAFLARKTNANRVNAIFSRQIAQRLLSFNMSS